MTSSKNLLLRPLARRSLRVIFGSASMVILAGCIAISYLSFSVWSYVGNLSVAKQGKQEHSSAQLEVEYLKLQNAIDAAAVGGQPQLE